MLVLSIAVLVIELVALPQHSRFDHEHEHRFLSTSRSSSSDKFLLTTSCGFPSTFEISYSKFDINFCARIPFTEERNRALSPNFAKGLVRYPKASPACARGPGPRARRPQQVWRATEPGPTLASVEFISAERTTESYQKQDFIVLVLAAPNPIHKKAKQGLVPEFRKRFRALPQSVPTRARGPGPRARRPQQVWRATEPGPTLASVEFISAEHTTESYQSRSRISSYSCTASFHCPLPTESCQLTTTN